MGQASAMSFEMWNPLPEKDRPKRPALFVEDTFDGKMMGDAWTMIAEKFGYEIALRVSIGLEGQGFHLTDSQSQGSERGCDFLFG